jgi:hypothetical protein
MVADVRLRGRAELAAAGAVELERHDGPLVGWSNCAGRCRLRQ